MKIQYKTDLPDRDQYFSLFQSTGWNDEYMLSKDELYLTLSKSFYNVAVYDGEKLIGFGRVISDGILHAMIYEMIVYPEYQGKGIGKEILKMLIKECKKNNIRDIQLFCAKGKREFYEKYGFVARQEDAPGMQLIKKT
jgi:GNAT superfamily N-acetyltransferase